MADFTLWKRENLERIAQDLHEENKSLREDLRTLWARVRAMEMPLGTGPGAAPAGSPDRPSLPR